MKGKLKLILLSMLALFLVACGSATPNPGGGSSGGDKPKIIGISEQKKSIIAPKKIGKRSAVLITRNIGNSRGEYPSIKDNEAKYSDLKYNNEEKFVDGAAIISFENINIYIDKDQINHPKIIGNEGHMYFIDENIEDYTVETSMFVNYNEIYVIGRNGGSTLKIDGQYFTRNHSNETLEYKPVFHLGLYVNSDETFSTDKIHITKDVISHVKTEVKFVYNNTDLKNFQNAKPKDGDYVIKVDGNVLDDAGEEISSNPEDAFKMEGTVPVGLYNYKLEHKVSKQDKAKGHIWKLEKTQ